MNVDEGHFSQIDPTDRVLLLSHCLRPSQTCTAKYDKRGLICIDDCKEDCVIGRLRKAALELKYKGVCIAPGGSLAIKYVKETKPAGIVAIACQKELNEGVESVVEFSDKKDMPVIISVPLTKDGCVDTEVDEMLAMKAICLGCPDIEGNE
jgi:hypothetical protein